MKTVTFYSTSFCPTCKFVKPEVQETYPDTQFVLLDDKMDLATELGVFTVPTIIIDEDGVELKRMVGRVTAEKFREMLIEQSIL